MQGKVPPCESERSGLSKRSDDVARELDDVSTAKTQSVNPSATNKRPDLVLKNTAPPHTGLAPVHRRSLVLQLGNALGNRHLLRVLHSGATTDTAHDPGPNRIHLRGQVAPVVQPMRLSIAGGTIIGRVGFRTAEMGMGEAPLRFAAELVPSGEAAGRFTGFEERGLAFSLAWQQESSVCAVVRDTQGRYHAFRTDWHTYSAPELRRQRVSFRSISIPHVADISWVNVPTERAQGSERGAWSWRDRVTRARTWWASFSSGRIHPDYPAQCPHDGAHVERTLEAFRRCLEAEFVYLLAQVLSIDMSDIYVARQRYDRNPNAIVTFDIFETSRGRSGARGPGDRHEFPTARGEAVPRLAWAIGPNAFVSESRMYTLATALHEVEHVSHGARYLELFGRYHRSGVRMPFTTWLTRQRDVSPAEREELLERARRATTPAPASEEARRRRNANTETLAHAEGFMAFYHRVPPRGPQQRFDELTQCARYWVLAGDNVKAEAIRRLTSYVRSDQLSTDHRQAIREQAERFIRTQAAQRPFWTQLQAALP